LKLGFHHFLLGITDASTGDVASPIFEQETKKRLDGDQAFKTTLVLLQQRRSDLAEAQQATALFSGKLFSGLAT
jgi:hypothetical protein